MRSARFGLLFFWLACGFSFSDVSVAGQQQVSLPNDDSAASLLQSSYALLSGGAQINDVTLSATVSRFKGKTQEQGTAVFTAVGNGQSQVALTLPSGKSSEVRTVSAQSASGTRTGTDGTSQAIDAMDLHSRPTAWFFPALILGPASGSPNYSTYFVGRQFKDGIDVKRIAFRPAANSSPGGLAKPLGFGGTQVYLDASTNLPVVISFGVTGQDVRNNATKTIPEEVHFSDYRKIQGGMVPFHIRISLGATVISDIQVSSIRLNTGAVVQSSN
jgi:hypothetical protein